MPTRGYGVWPQVTDVLGHTYRHWHHYLDLFDLSDEALVLAHRADLTEWSLRKIVDANLTCAEQVAQIQQLIVGRPKPEPKKPGGVPTKRSPAVRATRQIFSACNDLASLNLTELSNAVVAGLDKHTDDRLRDAHAVVETICRVLGRALQDSESSLGGNDDEQP